MTPTAEQEQVVEAVRAGGAVKVKAYAGAGKTSTLRMAAESRGRARGLYLAFNREIANEAARKFPQNTRCRTVHSLAYSGTRPEITRKLKNPVEPPHQLALRYGFGKLRLPTTIGKELELSPSKVARMVSRSRCASPRRPTLCARRAPTATRPRRNMSISCARLSNPSLQGLSRAAASSSMCRTTSSSRAAPPAPYI